MCDADRQTGTSRFVHSLAFGTMRAIRDRVRREAADLHVALVADVAVLRDVALDVVRVHRVGRQADRILGDALAAAVLLGHDVVADHPPGLADVKLVRPVVGVGELVLRQAPRLEVLADLLRHARMIGQRPHQPLLIVDVLLR